MVWCFSSFKSKKIKNSSQKFRGSGDKSHYAPLGRLMQKNNIALVVPNYTLYPQGKVEAMLEGIWNGRTNWSGLIFCDRKKYVVDICDVMKFVKTDLKHYYSGKSEDIFVIAHSAGAHLFSLYFISKLLSEINPSLLPNQYQHLKTKFQENCKINAFIAMVCEISVTSTKRNPFIWKHSKLDTLHHKNPIKSTKVKYFIIFLKPPKRFKLDHNQRSCHSFNSFFFPFKFHSKRVEFMTLRSTGSLKVIVGWNTSVQWKKQCTNMKTSNIIRQHVLLKIYVKG